MTRALSLLFVVFLTVLTAGCGLSPVYGTYANDGTSTSMKTALDAVYVDNIPDRTGQKLRNILIDRMVSKGGNTKADDSFKLQVNPISESIYGIGIAKDATATRSQIRLSTGFTLFDMRGDTPVSIHTGSVTGVASFNALASQYTTLVTEEDARDQAIGLLADQITTRLELYFANPSAYKSPE